MSTSTPSGVVFPRVKVNLKAYAEAAIPPQYDLHPSLVLLIAEKKHDVVMMPLKDYNVMLGHRSLRIMPRLTVDDLKAEYSFIGSNTGNSCCRSIQRHARRRNHNNSSKSCLVSPDPERQGFDRFIKEICLVNSDRISRFVGQQHQKLDDSAGNW
ncbi:hypothetical protein BD410DRAFT_361642 [Rickenella mellea]|uniref:Uncharacterized protein n=1 Tax=Rickenella mellea TaxID=50990 RepID=A0A4Y7PZ03_9AGAM|nr:hypothetical protein BD410DRAFT_361642 [Rickenella mellea]